jgi:thiosulfate dehydrogenase
MAPSFLTLSFLAVGATAVALLAIGHPHPQSSDAAATPAVPQAAAAPLAGASAAPHAASPSPQADWTVPNIDDLPNDDWGRTVRYGRELIIKTYALIGPEVADAGHRYSGNNLACESCHLEAATKQFGLPLQGVYADFPNYRAQSGGVGTIEDRINGCMTRSMNGRALPTDGAEMTAIVAYLKFLSTGRPVGAPTFGRGPGEMAELTRAADPTRGKAIYAQSCASCHGGDGQGQRTDHVGDAQGYSTPPLWGDDSFNDGAGMDRLVDAANFIRTNMPDGTMWRQPALSVQDSWDVAAFVLSQPRPHKDHLDRDFPVRTEKPADAAYGPFVDGFSAAQHKFGPFQPIQNALAALKAAATRNDHQGGNRP